VEDVRASRRWTWVALAWAIAASAIAIIALLNAQDSGDEPPARTTPDLTPRVEKLEQDTNDRLDAFSRRLNDRAAAGDIQKLDRRLQQAEEEASQAGEDVGDQADALEQLQTDVEDLQQRVDELEAQQQDAEPAP
jgi:peptidoglycan hydrolase CwlO-like protein